MQKSKFQFVALASIGLASAVAFKSHAIVVDLGGGPSNTRILVKEQVASGVNVTVEASGPMQNIRAKVTATAASQEQLPSRLEMERACFTHAIEAELKAKKLSNIELVSFYREDGLTHRLFDGGMVQVKAQGRPDFYGYGTSAEQFIEYRLKHKNTGESFFARSSAGSNGEVSVTRGATTAAVANLPLECGIGHTVIKDAKDTLVKDIPINGNLQ